MVKVLENRAVDLDIAPGVKDGSDLKNQADAVTYVGPLATYSLLFPQHYLSIIQGQSNAIGEELLTLHYLSVLKW